MDTATTFLFCFLSCAIVSVLCLFRVHVFNFLLAHLLAFVLAKLCIYALTLPVRSGGLAEPLRSFRPLRCCGATAGVASVCRRQSEVFMYILNGRLDYPSEYKDEAFARMAAAFSDCVVVRHGVSSHMPG